MGKSSRIISQIASLNFYAGLCAWIFCVCTIAAISLTTVSARADKDPDGISASLSLTQQILAATVELQEITEVTDRITDYALSYAYDPSGTINGLYAKLTAEQKAVGASIGRTRRRMKDFEHDPEAYAMIQTTLNLLEARYSDIFNEIIETNSKRRLPVSLIGRSKADAEVLFARKANLIERLAVLNEQFRRHSVRSSTALNVPTCESLFTP